MPIVISPSPLSPPPPRPVVPVPSAAAVREAERLLRRAGFNPGTVDGRTSPAFDKALREFQAAWGLPANGQLDARTVTTLRHTGERIAAHTKDQFVSVGQRSGAIKTIERRLKALGYAVGKADGVYSRETADAVKAFKADQGDIKNASGAIAGHGRAVLARELKALAHAPERRRLAPTKAQRQLDVRTTAAAAAAHADGTTGLGEGMKSAAVANVQKHLRAAGYSPKRTDGKFDERTRGALQAFQRHAGLKPSGRVDAKTWSALKRSFILTKSAAGPAQARGERSGAVRATEKLLKKVGLNPGRVDGFFDRKTEQAVKAFERKHHLKADGKISTGELAKLRKLARTAGGIQVTSQMRRLASTARSVGLSMGGYTGLGRCATGVSASIRRAMGVQVWGNGNQIDNNLPRSHFRQVHIPLSQALKIPGLVLTWEKTSSALGSIYGHTAITLGDGRGSASDFVEPNTLGAGGRSGLKIFVPIR